MANIGKHAYVAFGASGSETALTSITKTASLPHEFDEHDTTVFSSATDKTFDPGNGEWSVPLSCLFDATLYATLAAMKGVAGKSVIFGPLGNGSGKPKLSGSAWLKKCEIKADANGLATLELEVRGTGALTSGTFS